MPTIQSEDPGERVEHPRHYNQHPSNIETIELIEHLPSNLAAAVKYIWRCGLKVTETPLRDMRSAMWYTEREARRIDLYELDEEQAQKTDVVWRALARQVIEKDDGALGEYLRSLLDGNFNDMIFVVGSEIAALEKEA
jgi:hypothetical protein